jgi:hypothetical protein
MHPTKRWQLTMLHCNQTMRPTRRETRLGQSAASRVGLAIALQQKDVHEIHIDNDRLSCSAQIDFG